MVHNKVFRSVSGVEFQPNINYLEAVEREPESIIRICPSCGNRGLRVLKSNVGNHVDYKYWGLLDENFWFCPTKDCNIVYFNNRKGIFSEKRG